MMARLALPQAQAPAATRELRIHASAPGQVARLRTAVAIPIGASPNLGHVAGVEGFQPDRVLPPDRFATLAWQGVEAGATLVGGCCGTEPRHVQAVADLARRRRRGLA